MGYRLGRRADPVPHALRLARSIELTRDWCAPCGRAAYLASAELAAEKGQLPALRPRQVPRHRGGQARLSRSCPGDRRQGLRNALLTSIAPTARFDLAVNISSGLEPVFSFRLHPLGC